jgi:soluble lytic murein transglycosylase-like protein
VGIGLAMTVDGRPMHLRLFPRVLGAALLLTAVPAVAEAEFYYWRDASGQLVLSDKPKDPGARTYAVSQSQTFRTTRPLISRRAAAYESLIEEQATAQGVDANLVRAVIQAESAYDPRAVSGKGAMGLMQLMPATARAYNVLDAFDPAENIRAGVAYLKSLLVRYRENLELALAAYNAGPTAVAKYGDVPPYRETRQYVEKIRKAVDAKPAPQVRIYRTVEYVNGRAVPRYSTKPIEGAELIDPGRR